MKEGFRQSMAWLHTWAGLIVGWVLFFIFVTGTAGYFMHEISRWMRPELPLHTNTVTLPSQSAMLSLGLTKLEAKAPDAVSWTVQFPHEVHAPHRGWQSFAIEWRQASSPGQRGRGSELSLDPVTGETLSQIEARDTGGGRLLNRMHYVLHYVDRDTGVWLSGICTMLMLVAIITGVITHKKIFKYFFTFRPGKGQRSWLDAHNVISVMALPFFLMITYSGLVIYAVQYMPAPIAALYGTQPDANRQYINETRNGSTYLSRPDTYVSLETLLAKAALEWGERNITSVTIRHIKGREPAIVFERQRGTQVRAYEAQVMRFHAISGERLADLPEKPLALKTSESFRALHEAKFAGTGLRWLFFLAGLLGCGMIGTGLVLWTVKRRRQYQGKFHFGFRLVEALNLATIAGLPAAIAAYFWANRLLPLDMAERPAWEAHVLFLVWGEIFLFACFRQPKKAWIEIFGVSAAAFIFLPVLNAMTTERHLGVTLTKGDWQLAGFDLTMLLLGVIFVIMTLKVRKIWLKPVNNKTALPAMEMREATL